MGNTSIPTGTHQRSQQGKRFSGMAKRGQAQLGPVEVKRFLLVVRRALLMVVREIEKMYPDDFVNSS